MNKISLPLLSIFIILASSKFAHGNISFAAGVNPNTLVVTFEQDLEITITPSGTNQFIGDDFGLVMRDAYSSSNSLNFITPASITSNSIVTTSTGTFDLSQTNPLVADFSFDIFAQGATEGIFEDTDFFLGLSGDSVYIPNGGTGVITFSAGSVEITGWAFSIPDQVASTVILTNNLGGASTNTVIAFVPEPSTYALLAGVFALGLVASRRKGN